MTRVHCPTCHRTEIWEADDRQVELPGGHRQPTVAAPLAAWRVLRRAREGSTGPVVARCPACALPMVADDTTVSPMDAWTLETSEGTFHIGATLVGPKGEVDLPTLDATLEELYRPRWEIRPGQALFSGGLLTTVVGAIFGLWLFAAMFVTTFMANFGK